METKRQAPKGTDPVILDAADLLRAPVSRVRRRWLTALAGTALVHVLVVLPALLLIRARLPADLPPEPGVQVVFAPASQGQEADASQPPGPEPAASERPDTQAPPPAAEPPPPAQAEPPSPAQAEPPAKAELTPPEAEPPQPEAPPPSEQTAAKPPKTEPEAQPPLPKPPPERPKHPLPSPARVRPQPPPSPPRHPATASREAAAPPAALIQPPPAAPASQSAAAAAAPQASSAAIMAWRQALAAWLAAHKTYPAEARRQGIEGNVAVRFSINASGHVTDVVLLRGSGSPVLDAAAEALLRNATVPALAGSLQDHITISVQLRYRLSE